MPDVSTGLRLRRINIKSSQTDKNCVGLERGEGGGDRRHTGPHLPHTAHGPSSPPGPATGDSGGKYKFANECGD